MIKNSTLDEIFVIRFHPEACGGPKDTEYLFKRFINLMAEHK